MQVDTQAAAMQLEPTLWHVDGPGIHAAAATRVLILAYPTATVQRWLAAGKCYRC